jgi:hypothetical protein
MPQHGFGNDIHAHHSSSHMVLFPLSLSLSLSVCVCVCSLCLCLLSLFVFVCRVQTLWFEVHDIIEDWLNESTGSAGGYVTHLYDEFIYKDRISLI